MREEAMMPEEAGDDLTGKLAALGKPTAEFAVGGWRPILHLLAAPVATLLGVALGVGPFLLLRHFRGSLIKVMILGAFLVVAGVVMGVRAVRNWKARVLVYPEGLIYFRRGKAVALFFDQVQTLWRKHSEGHWSRLFQSSLSFVAESADEDRVEFSDYLPRIEDLGRILERDTLPHLLPPALAVYNTGGRVGFGPIELSREGLTTGKKTLPWDQVQEIKFENNQLTITQRDKWRKWFTVAQGEVPNLHVLRAVIDHARSARKTISSPGDATV